VIVLTDIQAKIETRQVLRVVVLTDIQAKTENKAGKKCDCPH